MARSAGQFADEQQAKQDAAKGRLIDERGGDAVEQPGRVTPRGRQAQIAERHQA